MSNAEEELHLLQIESNAARAAIQFAISRTNGIDFLQLWSDSNFDCIREYWPDVPPEVFQGLE